MMGSAGSIGAPLWTPDRSSFDGLNMVRFARLVNRKFSSAQVDETDYNSLWEWSVQNIPQFWGLIWEFFDIRCSAPFEAVVDDASKMPGCVWFKGAKLNFAENLLRFCSKDLAYIFVGENFLTPLEVTYEELHSQVAMLSRSLRAIGVSAGDTVAAYMPNTPSTGVAMLASTSIGAIWSSCSPDFGFDAVVDRFSQIAPRILFVTDCYFFKGQRIDILEKVGKIAEALPTIERIIVFPYDQRESSQTSVATVPHGISYRDFVKDQDPSDLSIDFEQLTFDHPVVIMYSSGTTGLPKCLVQGTGILLNHLKELSLHTDLKAGDRVFYFTTCGWMMWNWLTSALALGCTVVLYDGNPLYPSASRLWDMADELCINVFGTSAKYLSAVQRSGVRPAELFTLRGLRTILSTGSPATEATFEFVYGSIKSDVQFSSISGGTDLNGCFALGCPLMPVLRKELQCRGLGMHVQVFDDEGKPIVGQMGELTCVSSFPSMPLHFWGDVDGEKYHDSYFSVYPNVWRHGDFAMITQRGGVIIFGRSDATLNPGGVRIGTADIYRVLEDSMVEVEDSVVIGQDYTLEDGSTDVRVLLFVQLKDGLVLTEELENSIKRRIRDATSPRHVPSQILACPDVPYTISGKKVELAVKKALSGQAIRNAGSLRNPDSLEFFKNLGLRD